MITLNVNYLYNMAFYYEMSKFENDTPEIRKKVHDYLKDKQPVLAVFKNEDGTYSKGIAGYLPINTTYLDDNGVVWEERYLKSRG